MPSPVEELMLARKNFNTKPSFDSASNVTSHEIRKSFI